MLEMPTFFFISLMGLIAIIPPYFLAVEHEKLQKRYGKEKGTKIGKVLSVISGWGFFFFWFGMWGSPQPRFAIISIQNLSVLVSIINFPVLLIHLMIIIHFFVLGSWFGIKGTKRTTLKIVEIHEMERIVTTRVYAIVRHPQYFGGFLAHIGISFLLSALYSLLFTPLIASVIYLTSWKKEKELIKEFDKDYEVYRRRVPMLLPNLKSH